MSWQLYNYNMLKKYLTTLFQMSIPNLRKIPIMLEKSLIIL